MSQARPQGNEELLKFFEVVLKLKQGLDLSSAEEKVRERFSSHAAVFLAKATEAQILETVNKYRGLVAPKASPPKKTKTPSPKKASPKKSKKAAAKKKQCYEEGFVLDDDEHCAGCTLLKNDSVTCKPKKSSESAGEAYLIDDSTENRKPVVFGSRKSLEKLQSHEAYKGRSSRVVNIKRGRGGAKTLAQVLEEISASVAPSTSLRPDVGSSSSTAQSPKKVSSPPKPKPSSSKPSPPKPESSSGGILLKPSTKPRSPSHTPIPYSPPKEPVPVVQTLSITPALREEILKSFTECMQQSLKK